MGQEAQGTGKLLEVRVVFEPSRLEQETLWDAYEQVLPVVRRTVSPSGKGTLSMRKKALQAVGGFWA